jgi:hypothetical protein
VLLGGLLARVWPQFLALAAICRVFFVIAQRRFRSTIGQLA